MQLLKRHARYVDWFQSLLPYSAPATTRAQLAVKSLESIREEFKREKLILSLQCFRWVVRRDLNEPEFCNVNRPQESLSSESTDQAELYGQICDALKAPEGYSLGLDERHLITRAWLPAFDEKEELILLFDFSAQAPFSTSELGAFIKAYQDTLLWGFQSSDYSGAKQGFLSMSKQLPSQDMTEASERLLYYELWCSFMAAPKPRNESDQRLGELQRWLDSGTTITFKDNSQQDHALASYLASLLYLSNEDVNGAKDKLKKALVKTWDERNDVPPVSIHLRISRGPTIVVGPDMERTWCVVAQAATQLSLLAPSQGRELLKKVEPKRYRRKQEGAQSAGEAVDRQKARVLAARVSILEREAKHLAESSSSADETADLVQEAWAVAWEVEPLMKAALNSSDRRYQSDKRYVELSSRWLDAWFGLRLMESDVLPGRNIWQGVEDESKTKPCDALKRFDLSNTASLVQNWACYFRYLLSYFVLRTDRVATNGIPDIPTEPETDAVEGARLLLLCEWSHDQGVSRTIPLHQWLTKTYESELALYALKEKGSHRQHLFHVQDECLLGCAILYGSWNKDHSERYLNRLAAASGHGPQRLLCNWLVAALLHDIGYALQVVPQGLDALSDSTVRGLGGLVDDIKQRLKTAPHDLADYDPTSNRSSAQLEIADHAHVSMATVVSHLRSLNDRWQTASEYNPAAAAIIDHSSTDSLIDYKVDPLSMLIVVCDQLQDWGRPRVDPAYLSRSFLSAIGRVSDSKPNNVRSDVKKPAFVSIKALFPSSRLYVKAKLDPNCNLLFAKKGNVQTITFLLDGPQSGEGRYEPAVAWLDICRAYQRIDSPQPVPQIRVALQTRVAKDGVTELRRLESFARSDTEKYGTILDWLAYVRKGRQINYDRGTRYDSHSKHDSFSDIEWIEYVVPDLGREESPPLKGFPGKLYRSYSEYREKQDEKRKKKQEEKDARKTSTTMTPSNHGETGNG